MAFILPNGMRIDEDGLAEAFSEVNPQHRYVLDTKSGDVGCTDVGSNAGGKVPDKDRYIEISRVGAATQLQWIRELISELMLFSAEDAVLIRRLTQVLDGTRGGNEVETLASCELLLEADKNGWIHGWAQWKADHLWEEMGAWLDQLPIKIDDRFEGCGDCELCKLMEQETHNLGDFLEAEHKEKRKKKHEAK